MGDQEKNQVVEQDETDAELLSIPDPNDSGKLVGEVIDGDS
jgi:hypothetical protein